MLKRYLTSGTHEGSSSEYYSESVSSILRSSIDTFKKKQKIQSVLYEDSTFILKKLLSMKKRKTQIGANIKDSAVKNMSKFLNPRSLIDSSSQSSSSPGSFSRKIDRTSDRNRIILGEDPLNQNAEPIYEEAFEEEDDIRVYEQGKSHPTAA